MKTLIASIVILGLVAAIVGVTVGAEDTANVTATVTVQQISVTVSDGVVGYGALSTGASKNTVLYNVSTNPGGMNPADTQTATNGGNVAEKLNIMGYDSANWMLESAAGNEQYKHEFSINGGTNWMALSADAYQTLATSVAGSGGTQTFDLKITTPTETSVYEQQSVDVVVQAVAAL